MDLKGVFLKACKKEDAIRVADYVVRNPDSLSVLVRLMLDNNKAYSHRAGWALNTLMARNPIDLSVYTEQLLALFISDKVLNPSTRNLLHIFRSIDFNEAQEGYVLEQCFKLLESQKTEIAIRCLSVEAIFKIALKEPELLSELRGLMLFHIEHSKAAFRASCRKYIKLIDKRLKKFS